MNWTMANVGCGFAYEPLVAMMICFSDGGCRRGGLFHLDGRTRLQTPIGPTRSYGSPACRGFGLASEEGAAMLSY